MSRKKQQKDAGDVGRKQLRDRKPKIRKTAVSEDDIEAFKVPFYTLDESTRHLKPLADIARQVEQIKTSYIGPVPPSKTVVNDESNETFEIAEAAVQCEAIYAAYESENERFDWISRDYLVRDIVHMIAAGDRNGLQTLVKVVGSYEAEYEKPLAEQEVATIWTIVACEELWDNGVDRSRATKAQIREEAERLWARAMCHRKGLAPTIENIKKDKSKLPKIRWQRVWEGLGLRDIKNAPAGRPSKNR